MTEPDDTPAGRPDDVDTGFWLWMTALPLMMIGHVIDAVTTPTKPLPAVAYAFTGLFLVIAAALVVTFAVLMRAGYRWARTLLTAGGLTAVVYSVTSLFTVDRGPVAALAYAACTIVGSVLIVGGVYLLHRQDSHEYLTR
ncbi:hypothetical protein [Mycolicibacterium sp. J2]|uniref:hypothetical protein n=1 Tax=Mycolicibacterium sp. J2 TaxID=2993511 RepID=UPI00224A8A20|nr:hypothetical protein [Mycolicibacterium sp. J2]MCX2710557.1 hypothetical protein [Mycolicibacterium sp. J2]